MSNPISPGLSNCSLNSNDSKSSNTVTKKMPINKVTVGTAKGPNLKNVKSKVGSFNNVHHKPAGGDKKIESQKLKWETKSRVGSFENTTHKPQGGNVRVVTQKLEWNVKSKIGSLDNVKHVPGGGNVKIFDEKYTTSSTTSQRTSGESTPNMIDGGLSSFHYSNNINNDATDVNTQQQNIDELLRDTNEKLKLNH